MSCGYCLEPITTPVTFQLEDLSYGKSIYCLDCLLIIRAGRWRQMKESLNSVDCLAVFKSIQEHGLPMSLVQRDLDGSKSYSPIKAIVADGREIDTALDGVDLTPGQRDSLVNSLRELNGEVYISDIKNIIQKYWK